MNKILKKSLTLSRFLQSQHFGNQIQETSPQPSIIAVYLNQQLFSGHVEMIPVSN